MGINKIINWGILFGYNTKFSRIANKEMYSPQLGELAFNLGSERVNVTSFNICVTQNGLTKDLDKRITKPEKSLCY